MANAGEARKKVNSFYPMALLRPPGESPESALWQFWIFALENRAGAAARRRLCFEIKFLLTVERCDCLWHALCRPGSRLRMALVADLAAHQVAHYAASGRANRYTDALSMTALLVESCMRTLRNGQQPKLILLAAVTAIAVVVGVYFAAAHKASSDIHDAAERQLQIIALDLESLLEKFETLPYAIAYQSHVVEALEQPGDPRRIRRLNATLQSIQQQSKVAAIYLMDREGNTLASSNWDQPLSFVGRNFAFRPYFRQALAGRAGRFYGIGSATSEPGYFIAQPVYPLESNRDATPPIGVIAVKISLSEFEQAWRSSEEALALADRDGVVFLSNREAWRYHGMRALSHDEQIALAGTLQYAGQTIQPIADLPRDLRADYGEHVSESVGRLGWELMLFPSQARIARAAWAAAAAAALILLIAAVSLWALHQRRQRLQERLASRKALQQAAEELDRKIAQRTQELLQANTTLQARYAKLQEAEHLLRSTQNELVQAGKLAMLGQMAAGVTHELNQPLTAIRAFADNAVTFLSRGQIDRAGENLQQISAASARMGSIVGQLKGFARKSHDTVAVVELAQSIQASKLLLEADFRRVGALLEIIVEDPVRVLGDPVRTEQVLINLLRNALDAVRDAPVRRVTVRLRRDDDAAVLSIRDSGPGIAEQVAAHLFEPFFTTKPSGEGLGLGLAISSSIVQAMQGQLNARNHDEGGAEFTLRLPLAGEGALLVLPNETDSTITRGDQLVRT